VRRDEPQFFRFAVLAAEEVEEPLVSGLPVRVVSRGDDGASTLLARLPPGWHASPPPAPGTLECFVLDGDLTVGRERLGSGGYATLSRSERTALSSTGGAETFFFVSPRLEPRDGVRLTSAWEEQWRPSGLPGMLHISFRHPDGDGPPPGGPDGFLRLFAVAPGFRLDCRERHTCWEENLVLRGDMWMADRGVLGPRSCVANPRGLWHGPMVSKGGAVLLVHCDRPHTIEYDGWEGDPWQLEAYLERAPW
jgi:hypothetical protein